MPSDYHEGLVDAHCARDGWRRGNFLREVRARLALEPWRSDGEPPDPTFTPNGDIGELIAELAFYPDAFRFRIEHGPNWLHPVLCIEVLECVYTHPLDDDKLAKFEAVWWRCDGSERIHFRAYVAYGPAARDCELVVDERYIWQQMTTRYVA